MLWSALTLQLGYNASLVTLGAMMLGVAGGAVGAYIVLSRRALISDAIGHATLPGVALMFLLSVAMGGDGRSLGLLLLGSALSAGLGLIVVQWLNTRTRLNEDAAIGAVLSVFFGFGITLLTIIQTMETGQQAGLESFLMGNTAGMLRSEANLIAIGGITVLLATWVLRRPMLLSAFDREFASGVGINLKFVDLAMMTLALAVTVFGLKIVGLILIVAMLIIPPVTARFWANRAGAFVATSAMLGGITSYVGAALSATAPDLPTGPVIVLVSCAVFIISLFISRQRGLISVLIRYLRYRRKVHIRQGLLALAHGQPIYEDFTRKLLLKAGMIRADNVPTLVGRNQAARARLDESRWRVLRNDPHQHMAASLYDGLTPIETVLTPDQIAELDSKLFQEAV